MRKSPFLYMRKNNFHAIKNEDIWNTVMITKQDKISMQTRFWCQSSIITLRDQIADIIFVVANF